MHPWCWETWIPQNQQHHLKANEAICAGITPETGLFILSKNTLIFIEIPDTEMIPSENTTESSRDITKYAIISPNDIA